MPDCYARYRPRYPRRLVDDLLQHTIGNHAERLLDWGAGTGELTLRLSPFFDQVTAVYFAPDMVSIGREKAQRKGATHIDWVVGRAEDLDMEAESCDLITAAGSFHWMDRELLAERAFRQLKPASALAIVGGAGGNIRKSDSKWHKLAMDCLSRHVDEDALVSRRKTRRKQPEHDPLMTAGFQVEYFDYPTEYSWQLEGFVGYLYSFFSLAPPHVLAESRRKAFERDLLASLSDANPSGIFCETLHFNLTIAFKPDERNQR